LKISRLLQILCIAIILFQYASHDLHASPVTLPVTVPVEITLSPSTGSNEISPANYFPVSFLHNGMAQIANQTSGTLLLNSVDIDTSVIINAVSTASTSDEQWCLAFVQGGCQSTIIPIGRQAKNVTYYYYDLLRESVSAVLSPFTLARPSYHYATAPLIASSNESLLPMSGPLPTQSQPIWTTRSSVYYSSDNIPEVGNSTQQFSSVPVTYGLIGSWPLEEGIGASVYDISGNNNNGLIQGNASWASGSSCGSGNNCLSFDGSTGQIVVPPSRSLDSIESTDSVTVISFAKMDRTAQESVEWISSGGFTLYFYTAEVQPRVLFSITTSDGKQNYPEDTLSLSTYDSWHCIAGSYSAALHTILDYGDGQFSERALAGNIATLNGLIINERSLHRGTASAISIYNRALSVSEIDEVCASSIQETEHAIIGTGNSWTTWYYSQFAEQVSYSAIGNWDSAGPAFRYVSLGSPLSYAVTQTPSLVWVDNGSDWSITNPIVTNAGGERLFSASAMSGRISESKQIDPVYYHQFSLTASYLLSDNETGISPPILASNQFGQPYHVRLQTAPIVYWLDIGAKWSVAAPSPSTGAGESWNTNENATGVMDGSVTTVLVYRKEVPSSNPTLGLLGVFAAGFAGTFLINRYRNRGKLTGPKIAPGEQGSRFSVDPRIIRWAFHGSIVVAIAIYATFFGSSGLVNVGDTVYNIFPFRSLSFESELVNLHINGGSINPNAPYVANLAESPYRLLTLMLTVTGLPATIANRVYVFLPLVLLAESASFFGQTIVGTKSIAAKSAAALLAIFNPYTIQNFVGGEFIRLVSISALLVTVASFVAAVRSRDHKRRYIFMGSAASILLVGDPGFIIPAYTLLLVYAITSSVAKYKRSVAPLWSFGQLVLLSVIANLWWIFPSVAWYASSHGSSPFQGSTAGTGILQLKSLHQSLFLSLRGLYWISLSAPFWSDFWSYYSSPLGILTGAGVLVAAMASLLHSRNLRTLYLSIIVALGALLSTGLHYPLLGTLYSFAFNLGFPFNVYRDPYNYFEGVALVGLIGLVSITVSRSVNPVNPVPDSAPTFRRLKARRLARSSLPLLILCVICLNGLPLYATQVQSYMRPVNIPASYYDASLYLQHLAENSTYDFRIAILPLHSVGGFVRYNWSPYEMPDVANHFSPVPVIEDVAGNALGIEGDAALSFETGNITQAIYYLATLDVGYLLVHKDLQDFSPASIQKQLANSNSTLVFDTNELSVYSINRERLPFAFASNLSEGQAGASILNGNSTDSEKVSYNQVSPYTYVIEFGSNSSNRLFVNVAYDAGWRIYPGKQDLLSTLFTQPLPATHYSAANGSLNGWSLNGSKDRTVTLVFWPAVMTYLGALFSLVGFSISALRLISASHFRHRISHDVTRRAKIAGWLQHKKNWITKSSSQIPYSCLLD